MNAILALRAAAMLLLCLAALLVGACGQTSAPTPAPAEVAPAAQALPTEPPTAEPAVAAPEVPAARPEATAQEVVIMPPAKPSAVRGQPIFEANCAECHGLAGDGSGLAGAANFTDLAFMRGEKPSEFYKSVTEGRPGTAMPAWEGKLTEMERWDALYYVWRFATSPAEIEQGRELFTANCIRCHGEAGDGSALPGAANFTDQAFMSNDSPDEFFEKVTKGVEGTPMPAWGETFDEEEIWSLINYLWTFAYEHPAQ